MTSTDTTADLAFTNLQFQIIVPVFNEEKILEKVLKYAKEAGYLDHIVFVDDASTDSSPKILKCWASDEDVSVISLSVNGQKEGAIRIAMEVLQEEGKLLPYTILLDADSVIDESHLKTPVSVAIEQAISFLDQSNLSALALRLEAVSDTPKNLLYRSAFSDFHGMQFDNWLVSKQFQVWVINGSGGLFETEILQSILSTMTPDFETGDLVITAELMKRKASIGYYPSIKVHTFVPTTLSGYFNQRRRWERGTTKVLWYDRKFYIKNFSQPSLLAFYTVLHLALYIGIILTPIIHYFTPLTLLAYAKLLGTVYIFWQVTNLLKGTYIRYLGIRCPYPFFLKTILIHGIVWMLITGFARLTGFCEGIYYILKYPGKRSNSLPVAPNIRE